MTAPRDLVTQSEAARQTGVSRQRVNNLVRRCNIACYGPDRLVSLSDVKAWAAKGRKAGRPYGS